jgi:hypothetical protein
MMIEPGDAIVVEEFIFAGILVQIFLKLFSSSMEHFLRIVSWVGFVEHLSLT